VCSVPLFGPNFLYENGLIITIFSLLERLVRTSMYSPDSDLHVWEAAEPHADVWRWRRRVDSTHAEVRLREDFTLSFSLFHASYN
jgi:hypothetical protein